MPKFYFGFCAIFILFTEIFLIYIKSSDEHVLYF